MRGAGAPARPRAAWAAAVAVGTLVAVPLVVFGLPALLGHSVAPGDDITQSLPLRELVGRDLAHGTLPIFDPYLWSGSPLLAGWNAGAAYPLTWLFAVMPAGAAWALGLAAASGAAGVGTYALSRASGLGVAASWLGGFTFAFGGGMVAQVQHVGLVEGMSWVPLSVLAVLKLTEPCAPGRRAAWTAVLAASIGMVALSGEPRAVANAAVVLVIYAAWRLVRLVRLVRAMRLEQAGDPGAAGRTWRATTRSGAAVAAGALLGLGIGALQLFPGLEAVAVSQRSAASGFLFSAGSLPARWLLLFGVPDLLGGSGSFGQPVFFGSYNIAEVTGYAGVLALVAVGALAGRAVAHRRGGIPEWGVWYAVGAAGVVLALGSNTPLWHLLVRVPFYGGQRLQSRTILVADLALAMLLAHWADGWLEAGRGSAGRGRRLLAGTRLSLAERVGGTVPALALGAVALVALVAPVHMAEWMGASRAAAAGAGALRPWLVPFVALAGGAVALLWGGALATRTVRRALVCAFVVVDLGIFAVLAVVAVDAPGIGTTAVPPPTAAAAATRRAGPPPSARTSASASRRPVRSSAAGSGAGTRTGAGSGSGSGSGSGAGSGSGSGSGSETPSGAGAARRGGTRPLTRIGLDGRFAVYDPRLLHPVQLGQLGVPDANTLTGTASVEGYGSIVDGRYATLTGVHGVSGNGQDIFAPAAARDGVLAQLETTAVLAPAAAFVDRTGHSHARAAPPARPGSPGDRRLARRGRAAWELGAPFSVRSLRVRIAGPGVHDARRRVPPALRFGLVTASGHVDWAPHVTRAGRSLQATWPSWVRAVGVVAIAGTQPDAWDAATRTGAATKAAGRRRGRVLVGPPALETRSGRVVLDGALEHAVVPPRWRYEGLDGAFAIFRDEKAQPMLRLRGTGGATSETGATVHRVAGPALDPSSAVVRSQHGVDVVRAMAYLPGWHATWTPRGGQPARLAVHRRGAVQVVRVPPGTGVLTWHYRAPGLARGALIAATSALLVAALVVASAIRARDRRRPGHPSVRGQEGSALGRAAVRSGDVQAD